jgi:hypothetical protein
MMVKVEDIQSYGKEHLETVAASASNLQSGVQAIATAYGDYAKKSFEETKSFVEKLSGVKSMDKAIEAQTEFARSSYETFVAETQKIAGLYTDLAKQTFKPYEGLVAKFTRAFFVSFRALFRDAELGDLREDVLEGTRSLIGFRDHLEAAIGGRALFQHLRLRVGVVDVDLNREHRDGVHLVILDFLAEDLLTGVNARRG